MGKVFGESFRDRKLDGRKNRRIVDKIFIEIFKPTLHGFLPFATAPHSGVY